MVTKKQVAEYIGLAGLGGLISYAANPAGTIEFLYNIENAAGYWGEAIYKGLVKPTWDYVSPGIYNGINLAAESVRELAVDVIRDTSADLFEQSPVIMDSIGNNLHSNIDVMDGLVGNALNGLHPVVDFYLKSRSVASATGKLLLTLLLGGGGYKLAKGKYNNWIKDRAGRVVRADQLNAARRQALKDRVSSMPLVGRLYRTSD